MGILDHLTCLLRNMYAGQEETVRTMHGITDWFQIRKGVFQGCILSLCLLNFYAEYIVQNAKLDEAQGEIKIAGRKINNLRYADDTTLMAEIEEELKRLLMKVKGESKKIGLKLNIQKTKIMASCPITSWQIDEETMETVTNYLLDSKINADGDCNHKIKGHLFFGRKVITNLDSILKSRDSVYVQQWDCWIIRQFYFQFSHSFVSDSLRPHELQHARPPCLSPTPGVYPKPCPSSR